MTDAPTPTVREALQEAIAAVANDDLVPNETLWRWQAALDAVQAPQDDPPDSAEQEEDDIYDAVRKFRDLGASASPTALSAPAPGGASAPIAGAAGRLTDEWIEEITQAHVWYDGDADRYDIRRIARAIEEKVRAALGAPISNAGPDA